MKQIPSRIALAFIVAVSLVLGVVSGLGLIIIRSLVRALPLIIVVVFAAWFLTGCVFQPVYIEARVDVPTQVQLKDSNVVIDATKSSDDNSVTGVPLTFE